VNNLNRCSPQKRERTRDENKQAKSHEDSYLVPVNLQ
jgi:hypothetical protein